MPGRGHSRWQLRELLGVGRAGAGLSKSTKRGAKTKQNKTTRQSLFQSSPQWDGGAPGRCRPAVPVSLRGRRAPAPVQPLREVPQRRQEVAQVDLVFVAQDAVLGKEKRKSIRAGSAI